MTIKKPSGKCWYPDCSEKADSIALNRKINQVRRYCAAHALEVVKQDNPEYIQWCPNCDCCIGIN